MTAAPVVTVDGPSGSGKGTVCRRVAEALGFRLLDSGALYRLTGLAGRRAGLEATDAAGHARVAGTMGIEFGWDERGGEQVLLDGEAVTDLIRTETAGNLASVVASFPAVRAALLERQRAFARPPGLVADGRDMGTIVFPDAELKIFLTASAGERAQRRYKQLKDKGLSVSLADLSREIAERDHRDASRALAPLVPAPDAISLDSTGVSPDDVVARVLALARRRLTVTDPAGGPGTGVD